MRQETLEALDRYSVQAQSLGTARGLADAILAKEEAAAVDDPKVEPSAVFPLALARVRLLASKR